MSVIDRIIAELERTNRSQKDLTDYLGLDKSTFNAWKTGKSESYNKYLLQIAKYFNISIDYLLGKSTFRNSYELFDFYSQTLPYQYFDPPFDFGELIKQKREESGISLEEIQIETGFTISDLDDIENGLLPLNAEIAQKICSSLGTTVNQLLIDYGYTKNTIIKDFPEQNAKGVKIPVLGKVIAGIPISAVQDILDYEEISVKLASTGEFFALQVKGDSMEPRICEGDVLIIRQQSDAESGEIVIALINGDEATCKKLVKHEDGISLVSLNMKYEPMFFSNAQIIQKPVSIIGKVIENRQKY